MPRLHVNAGPFTGSSWNDCGKNTLSGVGFPLAFISLSNYHLAHGMEPWVSDDEQQDTEVGKRNQQVAEKRGHERCAENLQPRKDSRLQQWRLLSRVETIPPGRVILIPIRCFFGPCIVWKFAVKQIVSLF